MKLLVSVFVFFLAEVNAQSISDLPPPCFSEIYCYGRIIDSVMKNRIYDDSKTFVDLKLKLPPNETLESFDTFMAGVGNEPSKDELQKWLDDNFDPTGSELESWKPIDHKQNIELYNHLRDDNLKRFAGDLNDIWIELSRRMKDEVKVRMTRIRLKAP